MRRKKRSFGRLHSVWVLLVCMWSNLGFTCGNANNNQQIVLQMFQVFANVHAKPSDFSPYIAESYVQIADGHTLNYHDFFKHVENLHSNMRSIKFTFKEIAAEHDLVATHHIAEGVKQDGQKVTTEFFAFFTVKNNKIVRCEEVSRMIVGSDSDKNLSYH